MLLSSAGYVTSTFLISTYLHFQEEKARPDIYTRSHEFAVLDSLPG